MKKIILCLGLMLLILVSYVSANSGAIVATTAAATTTMLLNNNNEPQTCEEKCMNLCKGVEEDKSQLSPLTQTVIAIVCLVATMFFLFVIISMFKSR